MRSIITDIFMKRGNLDIVTQTRKMPYKFESRDWGKVSVNQIAPKIANKLSEGRGKAWNVFSLSQTLLIP